MGDGYPKCFDPYLRYAILTNFKTFESFDEKKFRLFLLVEFKQADLATSFKKAMPRESNIELGPVDNQSRYVTMRARMAAVLKPGVFHIWRKYVSRVELSLPLKPTAAARPLIDRSNTGERSPGALLVGVIDDGCPFAAAQFLNVSAGGAASTRVLAIWDQNQGKQPVKVKDSAGKLCEFGQTPSDFHYGLEFQRDSSGSGGTSPRQIGLDEWMGLHLTPSGSIDEDGCYADARFERLAPRQSHGAHVMDVFAGSVPTSSRIGPSPSWQVGTDPACSADVVFVQFPDSCIRDSTGVWLKAYVVDAIRYILSFASSATGNVVINLSYGPTTGPHDGTAELESALTALVAEFDGYNKKPKLEIAVAAGNSYLSEGHVVFAGDKTQPTSVEWVWRLPPDNTVLCFAEVWMKDDDATGVKVTLTSPSGIRYTSPPTPLTVASVGGPFAWSNDRMWRLQVGPTIAAQGKVAEHGDWKIKVTGIRKGAELHAYVARSDPNMGVRTGAKRSYFVDHNWELNHSAKAGCIYANGKFDKAGSLIHRFGTLNGIATAKDAGVHVAGGYIIANGRKSPYASAGPARGGPRVGPDFALPCDESYALTGIRAGGNRSGSVFRLVGTSVAAPQLARHVANLSIPTPINMSNPPEEAGAGDVEPP